MPALNHVYTVSQLCRETRLMLEGHFLSVQIEGELSNIARPASGHIYFTLKDESAQIQCAMFRPQLRKIGFTPDNGAHVLMKAKVSLYEARGNFQLIVDSMEAAGEGALRAKFDALKNKLQNEGLFSEQHKKPLPKLASKVGIITSPTGAAIHDILKVLRKRFPLLPVLIYPVSVQGDSSKQEIAKAIELANKRKDCDVLVLARGGGSLEDLWSFNEELVARAIHQSSIPIISAVGHEVDYSIADFVADYRAPTPSAAAETISPDQEQWVRHLRSLSKQLTEQVTFQIRQQKQQKQTLLHRLQRAHPGNQLQLHAQQLDECRTRLTQTPKAIFQRQQLRISSLKLRLLNVDPTRKLDKARHTLITLQHKLPLYIQSQIKQANNRLQQASAELNALSPLNTLDRGFSITKNQRNNLIVKSVNDVRADDTLSIQLTDGSIDTTVNSIHEDN